MVAAVAFLHFTDLGSFVRVNPRMASNVQVFVGEFDAETVSLYQAFNDRIADYALQHQRLGGPDFDPKRMTWVKPSFAWLLYRSGYGTKHGQNRLLKLKLPHAALASLLSKCTCVDTNKTTQRGAAAKAARSDDSTSAGRVQWDPERDATCADEKKKEPREMSRRRAIQIGLAGPLSQEYVASVVAIEDVTALGHAVRDAHRAKSKRDRDAAIAAVLPRLPKERPYMPHCSPSVLAALGMAPGPVADALARLGRGKAAAGSASTIPAVAHTLADATAAELPIRLAQLALSFALVRAVEERGLGAAELKQPGAIEDVLAVCEGLSNVDRTLHADVLRSALA